MTSLAQLVERMETEINTIPDQVEQRDVELTMKLKGVVRHLKDVWGNEKEVAAILHVPMELWTEEQKKTLNDSVQHNLLLLELLLKN